MVYDIRIVDFDRITLPMLPIEVGIMAFYLPLIFFTLVAVGGRYMIINFHKLFSRIKKPSSKEAFL